MKKAASVILAIFMLMVITVSLFACNGAEKFELTKENFYANWQQAIRGDTQLARLVIPGAHDAATANTVAYPAPVSSLLQQFIDRTTCQSASMLELMNSGVRYFDIRVTEYTNGVLYTYHSEVVFEPWRKVVNELRKYLASSKDFLILDFQHFGQGAAEKALRVLDSILPLKEYALPRSYDLNTVTMDEIAQSCRRFAVIWSGDTLIAPEYLFARETWLYSPYLNCEHLEPQKLIKQLDVYYDSYDGEGLFVLQSQCSTKIITTPRGLEDTMEPLANAYILSLSDELLAKTNIVMRDFVHENDKIQIILSLNLRKNYVIAGYEEYFRYIQGD